MTTLLTVLVGLSLSSVVLFLFVPITRGQEIKFRYPEEPPLSVGRLILAIKEVENTPRWQIGSAGERSEYQITYDVWVMWSFKPFEWASRSAPECTDEVLRVLTCHLAYIKGVLQKSGHTHSPYSVGCIYKGGETRWAEYRLRPEDKDYAQRLANLYCDH